MQEDSVYENIDIPNTPEVPKRQTHAEDVQISVDQSQPLYVNL